MKILTMFAGILLLVGFLSGCAVSGPDGGYVGVSGPPGPGVTVDPPGPAGISIGGL